MNDLNINLIFFTAFSWLGFVILISFLWQRMKYLNSQIEIWKEEYNHLHETHLKTLGIYRGIVSDLNEMIEEETDRANQATFDLQNAKEVLNKLPKRDEKTGRFTKSHNTELEELSSKF